MSDKPVVGILMGSASDLPVMQEASKILSDFGVAYEMLVTSAHRSPRRTREYVEKVVERGLKVLIVGAGGAAHLGGVVAAETTLPVIGVPIDSSALKGLDALLATVQMPAGIPVATMAIGSAGAHNAGVLAVEILALGDASLQRKLVDYRKKLADDVERSSKELKGGAGV